MTYVRECPAFVLLKFYANILVFNPFDIIFVYYVRRYFKYIALHDSVQFLQHRLLKIFSPVVYSCLLCDRLIDLQLVDLFLDSLICSLGLFAYCFAKTTLSTLFSLIGIINYQIVNVLTSPFS